jgi:hypothetical protein
VSATTATLIAGSFALLGVVIERLLRLIGLLRFKASGWEQKFRGNDETYGFAEVPIERVEKDATGVDYRCAIDLFNGKEVPTGLRDIMIVLVREDGDSLTSRPYDLMSVGRDPSFDVLTRSDVDIINVPPRQFVREELAASFDREGAVALATGRWERAEFVGERPKRPLLWRKTYRRTIVKR